MKKLFSAILLISLLGVNGNYEIDKPLEDQYFTYCSDWARSVAFYSEHVLGADYYTTYFRAYAHCIEQTYYN